MPPTSASTKRVNSLLKNIIGPHRHNISLPLLHASTFIAFNKKAMRAAAAKDAALDGSCDEKATKATIRNLRTGDRPLGFDWPAPACCAWILRVGAPRSSCLPRTRTKSRYVARAKTDMDNDDGETTMLGYRSVDGWKTLTKIADGDVFTVPFTDLVCALTAPVDEVCGTGRKTHIRFIGSRSTRRRCSVLSPSSRSSFFIVNNGNG